MTASAIVYPLDLCKTILAVNIDKNPNMGIFSTIKNVYKTQGFFSLYKGLRATMFGIAPYASLKLTFF
jgi:hypothetical protein